MTESNSVYVPPCIQQGRPVYTTIDNCDFKNDTLDRRNEFHGTVQNIIYQKSNPGSTSNKLKIERGISRSLNSNPFPRAEMCYKLNMPNHTYSLFQCDAADTEL